MRDEPPRPSAPPPRPARGRRAERLLAGAAAVALLPLAAYTLFVASLSLHEGERLREAPALPASGPVDGAFYKVTGPATSPLLDPPDYPEAKGALLARVDAEVKDLSGGGWTRTGSVATLRVEAFTMGGVQVALSEAARVQIEPVRRERAEGGGRRLAISAILPGSESLVAYGTYHDGRLGDAPHDRLLLTTADRQGEVLEMMAKAGRIKALVLAVAAFLVLILAGLAAHTARGTAPPPPAS